MANASAKASLDVDPSGPHLAHLVKQIAAGNQEAVGALYDLTSGLINAVALRILGSREDAEEIVLETYTKAWRTADRFDPGRGSVLAWLIAIARSAALDRLRSRGRAAAAREEGSRQTAEAQPGSWHCERIAIQRALESLPPEQRTVLELAYFAGWTHTELAGELGIPVGTVKTRMRLGLARLRKHLSGGAA